MDEPNTEPDTEAKPVRDVKTGRFVKGHKPLQRREIIPHPTLPNKDINGRYLSPASRMGAEEKLTITQMRRALQSAFTDEMVIAIGLDIYNCAMKTKDLKLKKELYEMLLDRILGKPQKEVTEISHKIQTKTEIDLTKLTQEELDTWEQLAGKTQTVEGSTTLYLGENVTRD